jgi:hypothetical protein
MRCKKLKREDFRAATSSDLTAMIWKEKRDVYILPNMHSPPAEGNFRNERGFCGQGTQNGKQLFYFPMHVETFFSSPKPNHSGQLRPDLSCQKHVDPS